MAFATAPVALSLFAVWPIALAAFGGDLFRSGGTDGGAGGAAVFWFAVVFGAWALALLAVGVRAVHGWAWGRSLAAVAIAAVPVAALAALQAL